MNKLLPATVVAAVLASTAAGAGVNGEVDSPEKYVDVPEKYSVFEVQTTRELITGIAALFLATGTAQANDVIKQASEPWKNQASEPWQNSDDYSRRLYCEWMNEVHRDQETTENVCEKSARAEPPDEFAGEWPKGIAGAWCFENKSKVGNGIEALFTRGDCSKTPERSLQVKADGYHIAYDTCTIGKVMLWLGTGPRDEPDDYHKRYQMIASCETKVDACTVKVNFYVRNDAKLGMWFLPADVHCEKRRLS